MVCRNGRVLKQEALASAPWALAAENLKDLARLNRMFGAHRILRGLLSGLVANGDHFSFLDVGAASGDLGASVRRDYPNARVVSLDKRIFHLAFSPPPSVAADAFHLPFRDRSFDFVFCSLLLHEFPDEQIKKLMARLHRASRRALIVMDLYRHPVAYHFLPATGWLFGWGEITLHDGPTSVEASFQPGELFRLAREARLKRVEVRRHLPWFRLSLVAHSHGDIAGEQS